MCFNIFRRKQKIRVIPRLDMSLTIREILGSDDTKIEDEYALVLIM